MNFSKAILEHISQRYPGTISVLPVLQAGIFGFDGFLLVPRAERVKYTSELPVNVGIALWNTMVMVFKVSTLLEIDLHGTRGVAKFVEKPNRRVAHELFGSGDTFDHLQVYWSDLGSPQRLLESQRLFGPRRPRAPTARSPLNLDDSELVRIAGTGMILGDPRIGI